MARFWDVPGPPKVNKKFNRSCSGRFSNALTFYYGFEDGVGMVLGGYWEGFGRVSEGFWRFLRPWRNLREAFRVAGLALMIRATRGRSRRPNHMRSHLDALQAMGPVNLRRVPHHSHSVAQQASFYIAFGTDFQGFWKAKWLPKFGFPGFSRRYFSLRLSIQFWLISRGSEPEK